VLREIKEILRRRDSLEPLLPYGPSLIPLTSYLRQPSLIKIIGL